MADAAKAARLPTLVGLQAQSHPAVLYARDLVANGEIGDIVSVNMRVIVDSLPERGDGRIWQGILKNGANPMTIPGGHAIDAMCHILGEFAEVSARVTPGSTSSDNPGTALDRSGHPNPVPRVVGPIWRRSPVQVRDVEFLRAHTTKPIKITEPAEPPPPHLRDFAPWRFSDACRQRIRIRVSCRH